VYALLSIFEEIDNGIFTLKNHLTQKYFNEINSHISSPVVHMVVHGIPKNAVFDIIKAIFSDYESGG
jgi:hypothetical protein